ncbi:MAG TPA: hypothetical protein VH143_13295 [Kofleriaceae bacterium]|jgi:hypothetical protein|nr:hypothetical protein [Kofleriaceae bacterium]
MNRAGRWVFGLAVSVAACGPSTPPPQSPANANVAASGGATCETAVGHLVDVMPATKDSAPPDAVKKVHDMLVSHCQSDAWSPQLMQCLTDMKAMSDADHCESLMTPAQNEALNKERGPEENAPAPAEATMPAVPPPAATSPSPAPPSSRSGTAKPGKSGDPCDGGN